LVEYPCKIKSTIFASLSYFPTSDTTFKLRPCKIKEIFIGIFIAFRCLGHNEGNKKVPTGSYYYSVCGKEVMMAKETKSKSSIRKTKEDEKVLHELIEKKAYEIYEKRGRNPGKDLDDWLEAEQIVNGQKKN
jgi:hypothetical protein